MSRTWGFSEIQQIISYLSLTLPIKINVLIFFQLSITEYLVSGNNSISEKNPRDFAAVYSILSETSPTSSCTFSNCKLTGALSVNWYVAPLVNPDGYEYTFTSDRLWRKNRCRDAFSFLQIVYRITIEEIREKLAGEYYYVTLMIRPLLAEQLVCK